MKKVHDGSEWCSKWTSFRAINLKAEKNEISCPISLRWSLVNYWNFFEDAMKCSLKEKSEFCTLFLKSLSSRLSFWQFIKSSGHNMVVKRRSIDWHLRLELNCSDTVRDIKVYTLSNCSAFDLIIQLWKLCFDL